MKKYTLKIKIQSLKNKLVKLKKKKIIKTFKVKKKKNDIKIFKTKKKKKIVTILKSPHVNKKSREHFLCNNIYTYNLNIKFYNIYELIDFLIKTKKKFGKNNLLKFKITKN